MASKPKYNNTVCDPSFAAQVRERSGVEIERCYQCMTCTLGCDANFAMDVAPNQIVRLTQIGMKEAVLTSSSIWVCTSCEACVTRCPNEINIPHLMDCLHQIALEEETPVKEPAVPVFHRAFMAPVRQFGRQFEVLMTGLFILKARKFSLRDMLTNAKLGFGMFTRGKLKFGPHRIKGTKAMNDIFQKTLGGRGT